MGGGSGKSAVEGGPSIHRETPAIRGKVSTYQCGKHLTIPRRGQAPFWKAGRFERITGKEFITKAGQRSKIRQWNCDVRREGEVPYERGKRRFGPYQKKKE